MKNKFQRKSSINKVRSLTDLNICKIIYFSFSFNCVHINIPHKLSVVLLTISNIPISCRKYLSVDKKFGLNSYEIL